MIQISNSKKVGNSIQNLIVTIPVFCEVVRQICESTGCGCSVGCEVVGPSGHDGGLVGRNDGPVGVGHEGGHGGEGRGRGGKGGGHGGNGRVGGKVGGLGGQDLARWAKFEFGRVFDVTW